MTVKFVVDDAATEGVRADHAVRVRFPSVDRAFALKLLKEGRLRIDNKLANLTARAVVGSSITIDASEARLGEQLVPIFQPIHEDRGLVVVDKVAGAAMHENPGGATGGGEDDDVLTGALLERYPVEPGFKGPSFLGRLDRATSGIVVAAMSRAALRDVEGAWRNGKVRKEYVVVVHGKTPPEGLIDIPLAARRARLKGTGTIEDAKTSFTTIASIKRASVVIAELHTGRTHQIRRHMKAIGHPIVGDPRYGDDRRDRDAPTVDGLMLHAWRLRHEGDVERLPKEIEAAWPARIVSMIAGFGLTADPREARKLLRAKEGGVVVAAGAGPVSVTGSVAVEFDEDDEDEDEEVAVAVVDDEEEEEDGEESEEDADARIMAGGFRAQQKQKKEHRAATKAAAATLAAAAPASKSKSKSTSSEKRRKKK